MFVTCLYAVLDPRTGAVPLRQRRPRPARTSRPPTASIELRARGMPLGLMPGMVYEENEAVLAPGDCVLLHSDGIVEAHAPAARDVRLPAPEGDGRRRPGRAGADRPRARGGRGASPAPTPSRRTTSRWSPCSALRAWSWTSSTAERGRQRARARSSASSRPCAGSRSSRGRLEQPQDRGRRGDDERDGARQRVPARPAGDDPRALLAGDGLRVQVTDRGEPRDAARSPRRRTSRRSSRASSGRAAGDCS